MFGPGCNYRPYRILNKARQGSKFAIANLSFHTLYLDRPERTQLGSDFLKHSILLLLLTITAITKAKLLLLVARYHRFTAVKLVELQSAVRPLCERYFFSSVHHPVLN